MTECRTSPSSWGVFSAKSKATANKLRQEKTQLRWYTDIWSLVTAIKSVKINP